MMTITYNTYQAIVTAPAELPPETGGLLGIKDGCVCAFVFDEGIPSGRMCGYIPDTKRFNSILTEWQKEDISFAGMVHTHYFDVKTLSIPDKAYIAKIMHSMPSVIQELYFPLVVMPQRELVVYRAVIVNDTVCIETDDITIC